MKTALVLKKFGAVGISLNSTSFAKQTQHLYFLFRFAMAKQPPLVEEHPINVEISDEIAEGTYANLAMIAHSNSEFILDFIRLMPGLPKAKVKARIIVTPEHAVRLMAALKDNIRKFEEAHGPIQSPGDGGSAFPFPMNFGPGGEA